VKEQSSPPLRPVPLLFPRFPVRVRPFRPCPLFFVFSFAFLPAAKQQDLLRSTRLSQCVVLSPETLKVPAPPPFSFFARWTPPFFSFVQLQSRPAFLSVHRPIHLEPFLFDTSLRSSPSILLSPSCPLGGNHIFFLYYSPALSFGSRLRPASPGRSPRNIPPQMGVRPPSRFPLSPPDEIFDLQSNRTFSLTSIGRVPPFNALFIWFPCPSVAPPR